MRYLTKDYVKSEIEDTISMMRLNNDFVPELSSTGIDKLAEDFIFDWTEAGDYEANFERTLREFLVEEFRYLKFS